MDIRKFYFEADEDDAEARAQLKPSQKGVMMNLREWRKLKATMSAIEDALEELKQARRERR